MDFFNTVSVEEAKNRLINNLKELKIDQEKIQLLQALERVLAKDIVADIDVPEFNRSTVDGYAVKAADTYGASEAMPSFLDLVGQVEMGKEAKGVIKSGEAIYVPTGAMVPEGANGVVMIEHGEKLDERTIAIYKPSSFNENIILKGDDIRKGRVVLKKGKRIKPQDIGVLAALGIGEVEVYKKPRFYIISTGDEIVDLNEKLELGKVRDINGYTLHSLIHELGGEVTGRALVKDNFDLLKKEIEKGAQSSDIVLVSAGSSVGARDYTYDAINSLDGKGVFVHGVAIKPGKPTLIGEGKGRAIFGLPGHPVSSIIVFKTFVEYFIKRLMGIEGEVNITRAIIDSNLHSSPGKETYQMVTLEEREGRLYAIPNFGKSGMITLLSKSCGYIIIGSHEEGINKGEEREIHFI